MFQDMTFMSAPKETRGKESSSTVEISLPNDRINAPH